MVHVVLTVLFLGILQRDRIQCAATINGRQNKGRPSHLSFACMFFLNKVGSLESFLDNYVISLSDKATFMIASLSIPHDSYLSLVNFSEVQDAVLQLMRTVDQRKAKALSCKDQKLDE